MAVAAFSGSVPEHYEHDFAPIIFEPYAVDMAARTAALNPGRVLEIAAGTGRVTRAMERELSASTQIVATDVNGAMLAVGESMSKDPRVTWQVADATALPFEDDSFDAVVAQFGVMFYPDRIQGHREAKRVLREGGSYLFSAWCPLDKNAWAAAVKGKMGEMLNDDKPYLALPFSYGDPEQIRADMAAAGFGEVEIEEVEMDLISPTARQLAVGVVQGSPLTATLKERGIEDLQPYTDGLAERYAELFGDAPLRTTMKALVVTSKA